MTKRRKTAKIDDLNIAPDCRVTVTEFDEAKGKMMFRTIGKCLYTPRAIAQVLKANKLTGKCTWVFALGGKELWILRQGAQLAAQV